MGLSDVGFEEIEDVELDTAGDLDRGWFGDVADAQGEFASCGVTGRGVSSDRVWHWVGCVEDFPVPAAPVSASEIRPGDPYYSALHGNTPGWAPEPEA